VAILASDDTKKRVARKNIELRDASVVQTCALAQQKHTEAMEPAPALGFKASCVFRLAVQCE
jgi:hypothetical protein